MSIESRELDAIHDIRRMMKRSSKFLSLSGLSGIAAGFWAVVGTFFAYDWIGKASRRPGGLADPDNFLRLQLNLMLLAGAVFGAAIVSAFYFTWRRAALTKLPLWDHSARALTLNMMIPLVAGGLLILAMLQHGEWRFVTPICLIFYGLALVNGSKYTLSEIRYLGLLEVALGLLATQFPNYGVYFWAAGFGGLHIIYGFVMWWKNERQTRGDVNLIL